MASKNKFGLDRYIPEDVKRQVRIHCGFGCAICAATVYEYEHFLPDFADATTHDPNRIVLLCPDHHRLVTNGTITKERVAEAYAKPAAKQAGFSSFSHPWFTGIPSLKMGGGVLIKGTPVPIQIKGENIIQFDAPEPGSNVTCISATLRSSDGSQVLTIVNNEWRVLYGKWDFEFTGGKYIFKNYAGTPFMIIRMQSPDLIAIELLRTSVNGIPIVVTEDKLVINTNTFINCISSGSNIGFRFS